MSTGLDFLQAIRLDQYNNLDCSSGCFPKVCMTIPTPPHQGSFSNNPLVYVQIY